MADSNGRFRRFRIRFERSIKRRLNPSTDSTGHQRLATQFVSVALSCSLNAFENLIAQFGRVEFQSFWGFGTPLLKFRLHFIELDYHPIKQTNSISFYSTRFLHGISTGSSRATVFMHITDISPRKYWEIFAT